jgi:hypothetical protein
VHSTLCPERDDTLSPPLVTPLSIHVFGLPSDFYLLPLFAGFVALHLIAMTSSASSNVFFTGTVHQAIAFSVVQRLPLVCFVTDGGEEASLWENEYLTHPEVQLTPSPSTRFNPAHLIGVVFVCLEYAYLCLQLKADFKCCA